MNITTLILIVVIVAALFLAGVGGAGGSTTTTMATDTTGCYSEWEVVAKHHWAELSVIERANIAFQSILDCE